MPSESWQKRGSRVHSVKQTPGSGRSRRQRRQPTTAAKQATGRRKQRHATPFTCKVTAGYTFYGSSHAAPSFQAALLRLLLSLCRVNGCNLSHRSERRRAREADRAMVGAQISEWMRECERVNPFPEKQDPEVACNPASLRQTKRREARKRGRRRGAGRRKSAQAARDEAHVQG